jgi:hypothetical protein
MNLRFHLANPGTITPKELLKVAGSTLAVYLVHEGAPDPEMNEELGDYWKCQDLGKWMREHPKLAEMYVEGKRMVNPSGRTCEDNERARQRKLNRLR